MNTGYGSHDGQGVALAPRGLIILPRKLYFAEINSTGFLKAFRYILRASVFLFLI